MAAKKNSAERTKKNITYILLYTFLIILALVYLLPLVWIVVTSLKDDAVLFISPFAMPEKLMIENYTFAWTAGYLGKATLNSAFVCIITLLLSMIVGTSAY